MLEPFTELGWVGSLARFPFAPESQLEEPLFDRLADEVGARTRRAFGGEVPIDLGQERRGQDHSEQLFVHPIPL